VLQPASSRAAQKHYADTIERPVPHERLARLLPAAEATTLRRIYGETAIPVWGVTPGESGRSARKWADVEAGDVVLFSRKNFVFASAVVTHRAHDAPTAIDLWGRDDDGDTWEYLYFLDELTPRHISYEDFNRAAGYELNNVIQGFDVLSDAKSASVLAAFALDSPLHEAPVTEAEYRETVAKMPFDPEQPLDGVGRVLVRKEQSFLRKFIFGNRQTAECFICGRLLPKDLLVAAHIKARSECSTEERLDFRNLVVPMCKLGCDDLFERGYLSVEDGRVIVSARVDGNAALAETASVLRGRACASWRADSAKYFQWHREGRFK